MSESEQPLVHTTEENLIDIVDSSGSDTTALASRLGVLEQQATEIVALLEREQISAEIDVISKGRIAPGSANMF